MYVVHIRTEVYEELVTYISRVENQLVAASWAEEGKVEGFPLFCFMCPDMLRCFLFRLILNSQDGVNTSPQNDSSYMDYTVVYS